MIKRKSENVVRLIQAFACILMLTAASQAEAKTPDGETPALETVCDLYQGAAFGACNAYCEAMDCHLEDPKASPRACERKRDRFIRLTGELPPCEASCPCQALEGFMDFVEGETEANLCTASGPLSLGLERRISPEIWSAAFVGSFPMGGLVCGYFDSAEGQVSISVSASEFDFCADLLVGAAEDAGLSCEPDDPPPS